MRNLFEHTSASWVKYSSYEYKEKKRHPLSVTDRGCRTEAV